jgi:hypothetical protein
MAKNTRNAPDQKPNAERDKQDIGRTRSLARDTPNVVVGPFGQMTASMHYSLGYTPGINQGTGADWFGPLNPMSPTAPIEVEGRRFDFPSGYNLNVIPRAYEAVSFSEMRALADAYDILRLVIETRKDQMEKLAWTIKPKLDHTGKPMTSDNDIAIGQISSFLERPDGMNDWGAWLRAILEDLFVIDAPTLYCHETMGGKLLGLEQLDGATIKRVIDDWGRTPAPPIVAYQQILKGLPALDYTADQLIYMPRNSRVHKVYGFSPVEQIIMTVNIALRRQLFQLQYYTEGNIPEALVGTPDQWTPKQVQDFQDAFDTMLTGNLANRRRIKFVPGGVAKTFIATKEAELTGAMDTYLAKVVSFAFSISAQWVEGKMNRATAETAQEASLEEGLAPIMNYVTRLMNFVIRKYWPDAKVEFGWVEEEEVDQSKQADILTKLADGGILRMNEARETLGYAPDPKGNDLRYKGAILKTAEEEKAAADAMAESLLGGGSDRTPPGGGGAEEEDAGAGDDGKNVPPFSSGAVKKPVDDKSKDGGDAEKASSTFLVKQRPNYYSKGGWHLGKSHKGHRHDAPHKGSAQG